MRAPTKDPFLNREELERRRTQEIEQFQNPARIHPDRADEEHEPFPAAALQQWIDDLQRNRRKGAADVVSVPPEVNASLGSAYFKQGKMEEAEKESKRRPKSIPSWTKLLPDAQAGGVRTIVDLEDPVNGARDYLRKLDVSFEHVQQVPLRWSMDRAW